MYEKLVDARLAAKADRALKRAAKVAAAKAKEDEAKALADAKAKEEEIAKRKAELHRLRKVASDEAAKRPKRRIALICAND